MLGFLGPEGVESDLLRGFLWAIFLTQTLAVTSTAATIAISRF